METVRFLVEYFFNWSDGGWFHFVLLTLLCYLLAPKITIHNENNGQRDNTPAGVEVE